MTLSKQRYSQQPEASAWASSENGSGPGSLYVIQLSDLHLFAQPEGQLLGVATEETFCSVLAETQSYLHDLDFILLTGDLSQDGSPQSYARLREHLSSLSIEAYWIAGNHDQLDPMSLELEGAGLNSDKVFNRQNWTFILMNTLQPGREWGVLSPEALQMLYSHLQVAQALGTHVLISLHHPPFHVGSAWLDQTALQQPETFFQVLDQFDHIRLVLCGHIHQDHHCQRHGVDYLSCPSTCFQFKPASDSFRLDLIPPGFRQLWLYPDGNYTTSIQRVPAGLQYPNLSLSGY
ncbi:MAG: 3',5'-cyclic-AMP phosphodiesterase [Synechococcaceae cyanobacterium SM2_3_1]|nr:3',5'-cyclic-AMP phosphodiesterase [Synechococcaceae cyanobacterium SM2_3_1]